jgi:ribosomal protein S18 acetylase RimI-like enzyme
MEIRAMTVADLAAVAEIDATIESDQYLHIDRGGEGLSMSWKIQPRPLREKRTLRHDLTDEQSFAIKQIAAGADEGTVLVAAHDGQIVGAAAAQTDTITGVIRILDLRVDFDYRRQGLAQAMMFQIIQSARESKIRAMMAVAPADNFPAAEFLVKLGFELGGLDTLHQSNHDLVKESVALFWYLTLP